MSGSSGWMTVHMLAGSAALLGLNGLFLYLVAALFRGRAGEGGAHPVDLDARLGPQRDPVCGMSVHPASAAAEASYGGQSYYFCSARCAERFRTEPKRFAGGPGGPVDVVAFEQHEPPYTTTDGTFTSPKFGAAGSGGLEYERLPERHGDEPGKPPA